MKENITPIPPLPKEIVSAINNHNLAVFIGAGASRLIDCLGWDEFARNLVNRLNNEKLINYKEKETLVQNSDHKKTITICFHLFEKEGYKNIFYDEMKMALREGAKINIPNIYDEIYRMRGLFITTNADTHFNRLFNPHNILYRNTDFDPNNIGRTNLYHIHGSILDEGSLVFTLRQYFIRYNDKQFITFLKRIFNNYVVLFLGYGLAEFELLDYILGKYYSGEKIELKHFILLPFYRGEENILNFEQAYYNEMGIRVLPYEKDINGYKQLYEVVKIRNKEISQVSGYLYDSFKEIDDATESLNGDKLTRVLQIIKNDKPLEDYFFKKLSSISNPLPLLKPLKEKVYFDPRNNPRPQEVPDQLGSYTIPHWNVLDYLENIANKNLKEPQTEITDTLIEIIDSIINYRDEKGERIDNYGTDWVITKIISTLPIEKIKDRYIEFIRASLKSKWRSTLVAGDIGKMVLPRLIEKKARALVLKLLDVMFDYEKKEKQPYEEYKSIMDDYGLQEALKEHTTNIVALCGLDAANIALRKMESIISVGDSHFNNMWIPTIEDRPQNMNADEYECQLVHFVRNVFERMEATQVKDTIKELLKKDHPIFKRFAIHTINHHYGKLNDLFWTWDNNPLNESELKHEIYELLKNNCTKFSEESVDKILKWIESKEYYLPEQVRDDVERENKALAYRKREWLSALLDSKNAKIIEKYELYAKVNPAEIEHPGFDYWMETGWGGISPISEEELCVKSNPEIAEYLNSFKETVGLKPSTRDDLSNMFRISVSNNPEKFSIDLEPFLNVYKMYQHSLLWGLVEAWRNKRKFEWGKLFAFILKLIEPDEFWKESYDENQYNYRDSIISQIAELINEGTRDDSHAFDPELLPAAEKILLILLNKTEARLPEMVDLITSVLNSTKGKIFTALINYSLRYARLYKKDKDVRWVDPIKEEFERRLNREYDPSIEFSVILGEYLPNLYYLDKSWVIEKVNHIFTKNIEEHWKSAFSGYIFNASTVYKDIYFLLRKNGHYAKAIETKFEDDHIEEGIVQHICIGYIERWENLEDKTSLISRLIEKKNPSHLSEIISFLWRIQNRLIDKEKIKPLWKVLFEIAIQNLDNSEYKGIISDLSKWLSLIDEIDDATFEWLKTTAKYVEVNHNTSFFIKGLLAHVDKMPEKAGKLYLEMCDSEIYPYYRKEDIRKLVQKLYETGQKEFADRICNKYGEKGYHFDFLRELYEKYKNVDNE
ncbi:MAG TPA: SIR2 family protein [Candidatus Wujingus californicus]|uniref:SIR2 family protein n=1 Tax=Candidatus Wujingus californicus TaxID=3367618 RepID=UPI00402802DD